MDRGYTPKQFISLFDACNADPHLELLFTAEFEVQMTLVAEVNAAAAAYKT